ncbi:MAG: hypothetical protein KDD75_04595, partial [Caldilineaceae bacterium]|nr:hypothetical protein [Caldilineaceae bacterium]
VDLRIFGQSVVRELRHGVLHGRLPAGFAKPIMPPLYHRPGSRHSSRTAIVHQAQSGRPALHPHLAQRRPAALF